MPANSLVTSPLLNQWKLKSKMQSWSAEWTFLHLYIESFHGEGFGECCRSFPNFQLELCLFVQISKFCISSLQLKILLLLLLMQMHCCFVLRCTVCSVQCAVCRSGFILQLKILLLLLLLLLLCSTLHSQCTVWSVQCAVHTKYCLTLKKSSAQQTNNYTNTKDWTTAFQKMVTMVDMVMMMMMTIILGVLSATVGKFHCYWGNVLFGAQYIQHTKLDVHNIYSTQK